MTTRDDDEDVEIDPEAAERAVSVILWNMLGLEEEEVPLCDDERIDQAIEQRSRKRALPRSIKGDEMSWGLWCLKREGLRARLERAVRVDGVAEWLLTEADSWTDDELRAWLAKHEIRETRAAFAEFDERKRIQRDRIASGARHVLVIGALRNRDAIRQLVDNINREEPARAFEVFHIRTRDDFDAVPAKVRSALACVVIDSPPAETDVRAPEEVPRVVWIGRRAPYDQLRAAPSLTMRRSCRSQANRPHPRA